MADDEEEYDPSKGDELPFANPTREPQHIYRFARDSINISDAINAQVTPSQAFAAAMADIRREVDYAAGSNTRLQQSAAGTATAVQGITTFEELRDYVLSYASRQEEQGRETNEHLARIAASTERLEPIEQTLKTMETGDRQDAQEQASRDYTAIWVAIIIGLGAIAIAIWITYRPL